MSILSTDVEQQKEMAQRVTVNYILTKAVELLDGEETPPAVKFKVLEMLGKHRDMFIDKKKVNVDIRTLLAKVDDLSLARLAGGDYVDGVEILEGDSDGPLALRDPGVESAPDRHQCDSDC